jgi:predicted DNA binding CopG/RHH family protein
MVNKTMINNKKSIPRFKTLAQEAEFWDHHSPLDYDFRPAPVEFSPKLKKRLISIRIHETLLQGAKLLAAKRHIPYQTLIHTLLEKTIRLELRKAA